MELRDEYPVYDRNGYLHSRSLDHERTPWKPDAYYAFIRDRPRLSPQGLLTTADKRELERRKAKYGMEI